MNYSTDHPVQQLNLDFKLVFKHFTHVYNIYAFFFKLQEHEIRPAASDDSSGGVCFHGNLSERILLQGRGVEPESFILIEGLGCGTSLNLKLN